MVAFSCAFGRMLPRVLYYDSSRHAKLLTDSCLAMEKAQYKPREILLLSDDH